MQVTLDFIHSNEDLPIMLSAVNKVFTYSKLLSIIITYEVLEGEGSIRTFLAGGSGRLPLLPKPCTYSSFAATNVSCSFDMVAVEIESFFVRVLCG